MQIQNLSVAKRYHLIGQECTQVMDMDVGELSDAGGITYIRE